MRVLRLALCAAILGFAPAADAGWGSLISGAGRAAGRAGTAGAVRAESAAARAAAAAARSEGAAASAAARAASGERGLAVAAASTADAALFERQGVRMVAGEPEAESIWRKVGDHALDVADSAVDVLDASGVTDADVTKLETIVDEDSGAAKAEAELHRVRAAQIQKLTSISLAVGGNELKARVLRLVEKERLRHALALLQLPRRPR